MSSSFDEQEEEEEIEQNHGQLLETYPSLPETESSSSQIQSDDPNADILIEDFLETNIFQVTYSVPVEEQPTSSEPELEPDNEVEKSTEAFLKEEEAEKVTEDAKTSDEVSRSELDKACDMLQKSSLDSLNLSPEGNPPLITSFPDIYLFPVPSDQTTREKEFPEESFRNQNICFSSTFDKHSNKNDPRRDGRASSWTNDVNIASCESSGYATTSSAIQISSSSASFQAKCEEEHEYGSPSGEKKQFCIQDDYFKLGSLTSIETDSNFSVSFDEGLLQSLAGSNSGTSGAASNHNNFVSRTSALISSSIAAASIGLQDVFQGNRNKIVEKFTPKEAVEEVKIEADHGNKNLTGELFGSISPEPIKEVLLSEKATPVKRSTNDLEHIHLEAATLRKVEERVNLQELQRREDIFALCDNIMKNNNGSNKSSPSPEKEQETVSSTLASECTPPKESSDLEMSTPHMPLSSQGGISCPSPSPAPIDRVVTPLDTPKCETGVSNSDMQSTGPASASLLVSSSSSSSFLKLQQNLQIASGSSLQTAGGSLGGSNRDSNSDPESDQNVITDCSRISYNLDPLLSISPPITQSMDNNCFSLSHTSLKPGDDGKEEDFGSLLERHEQMRQAAKNKVEKLKVISEEVKLNQAAAIKEQEEKRSKVQLQLKNEISNLQKQKEFVQQVARRKRIIERANKTTQNMEEAKIEKQREKIEQLKLQHEITNKQLDTCPESQHEELLLKYKFEADQLEYELQIFEDMEFHLLEKEMVLDPTGTGTGCGNNSILAQLEVQEKDLVTLIDSLQATVELLQADLLQKEQQLLQMKAKFVKQTDDIANQLHKQRQYLLDLQVQYAELLQKEDLKSRQNLSNMKAVVVHSSHKTSSSSSTNPPSSPAGIKSQQHWVSGGANGNSRGDTPPSPDGHYDVIGKTTTGSFEALDSGRQSIGKRSPSGHLEMTPKSSDLVTPPPVSHIYSRTFSSPPTQSSALPDEDSFLMTSQMVQRPSSFSSPSNASPGVTNFMGYNTLQGPVSSHKRAHSQHQHFPQQQVASSSPSPHHTLPLRKPSPQFQQPTSPSPAPVHLNIITGHPMNAVGTPQGTPFYQPTGGHHYTPLKHNHHQQQQQFNPNQNNSIFTDPALPSTEILQPNNPTNSVMPTTPTNTRNRIRFGATSPMNAPNQSNFSIPANQSYSSKSQPMMSLQQHQNQAAVSNSPHAGERATIFSPTGYADQDISPMSFNPSTVGGDDLGNSRGDFFDSSGSLVRKRGAPKTSNTAEGTPPPQPQQPGFYPQGIPPDQIRTSPSLKTQARPLTCYLPNPAENFDLKSHLESLGHWMQGCRDILVDEISCRGPLLKRSSSLGVSSWKRRWFVFDRVKKTLVYYSDFKQCKLKGGVPFSSIQEVYFDHLQQHKSPNPNFTFIVKTKLRPFSLVAPTASCMRMWMDAIVTGCEGNDIYTNTNIQ